MDGHRGTLSLATRGTRVHFDVAVVLTSILPVLALSFVFMRLMRDEAINSAAPALVILLTVALVIIGNLLMSKYPLTLIKLRDHLQHLASGELPVQISLDEEETDITAIEEYLNEILTQLKKKLHDMELEQTRLEMQLCQAHRLQSIGALASGVAHEINTPIQFVGDNTRFVAGAITDIFQLLASYKEWAEKSAGNAGDGEQRARIQRLESDMDLAFLVEEIPPALEQSLEGIDQAAHIARTMKEFSHLAEGDEGSEADINRILETTIAVCRNEWKYVADVVCEFDQHLPLVPCHSTEIKQVVLNLIVNAAQAIESDLSRDPEEKGQIRVSTSRRSQEVEIVVSDTGGGIPPDVQEKMFNSFFTTKCAGRGSGQGLSIARTLIEKKHGGRLICESEQGKGARFIIRLPLSQVTRQHGAEAQEVSQKPCAQQETLLCAYSW